MKNTINWMLWIVLTVFISYLFGRQSAKFEIQSFTDSVFAVKFQQEKNKIELNKFNRIGKLTFTDQEEIDEIPIEEIIQGIIYTQHQYLDQLQAFNDTETINYILNNQDTANVLRLAKEIKGITQ